MRLIKFVMITLLDLEFESGSQNNSGQYTSELIKSQSPVTDTLIDARKTRIAVTSIFLTNRIPELENNVLKINQTQLTILTKVIL